MRRRNRGGSLQEILRRRLESFKSKYSTVDEMVNHLRSNYPDYQRTKRETLTRFVKEAMKHEDDDDEEEEEGRSAPRKRSKRNDENEERLQKMEALHLQRNRMRSDQIQGSPSTSSSASTSSSSESNDGDGAISTSEDAVYVEKFEPAIDLTKTMLRESYMKDIMEEKKNMNVELDVANSSKATAMNYVDGGEANLARKQLNGGGGSGGDGDVEVKGKKDGPRFRDLGGMKEVLEELKMEVIVPLYHPQLPRQLGVRPMTGILLHGPPGCGKTKLAHAIANETSLPFYQISATEVVSGVSGCGSFCFNFVTPRLLQNYI